MVHGPLGWERVGLGQEQTSGDRRKENTEELWDPEGQERESPGPHVGWYTPTLWEQSGSPQPSLASDSCAQKHGLGGGRAGGGDWDQRQRCPRERRELQGQRWSCHGESTPGSKGSVQSGPEHRGWCGEGQKRSEGSEHQIKGKNTPLERGCAPSPNAHTNPCNLLGPRGSADQMNRASFLLNASRTQSSEQSL